MIKFMVFLSISTIDLIVTYMWDDGVIFVPTILALLLIASLIWLGRFWNALFQPWVITFNIPVITQETPLSILALFGWILLIMLSVLLLVKCI